MTTKRAIDFRSVLRSLDACLDARVWVGGMGARDAWEACERPDWLFWLLGRIPLERKYIVLPACALARTALVHVPGGELRPLRAIETAESWCRGEASIGDVIAAGDAAWAAAWAAWAAAAAARADAWAAARADAWAAAWAAAQGATWAARAARAATARAAAAGAARAAREAEHCDIIRATVPWRVVRSALLQVGGAR